MCFFRIRNCCETTWLHVNNEMPNAVGVPRSIAQNSEFPVDNAITVLCRRCRLDHAMAAVDFRVLPACFCVDFQRDGLNWRLRHESLHLSRIALQVTTTSLRRLPRHGVWLRHPPCQFVGCNNDVWPVLSQILDSHTHASVRPRRIFTHGC